MHLFNVLFLCVELVLFPLTVDEEDISWLPRCKSPLAILKCFLKEQKVLLGAFKIFILLFCIQLCWAYLSWQIHKKKWLSLVGIVLGAVLIERVSVCLLGKLFWHSGVLFKTPFNPFGQISFGNYSPLVGEPITISVS